MIRRLKRKQSAIQITKMVSQYLQQKEQSFQSYRIAEKDTSALLLGVCSRLLQRHPSLLASASFACYCI